MKLMAILTGEATVEFTSLNLMECQGVCSKKCDYEMYCGKSNNYIVTSEATLCEVQEI